MLNMTRAEAAYCWQLFKALRSQLRTDMDFPAIIELQTMNRCNADCPMCPYPDTIGKQDLCYMSDELFEKIIGQLAGEPAFQSLVLSFQNEPFVDKNLLARAKTFKKLLPNKILQVVTNGSLLQKFGIPQVYEYFDLVSISVSATSKQKYEQVMKGLSWETVNANLGLIASKKAWVDKTILRFIRQEANEQEASEFKRHWNKKGFRVFGFEINSRVGLVKDYKQIRVQKGVAGSLRMQVLKFAGKLLIPSCPIPFISFYIRADGDAVLCFNDYGEDHIYGNLSGESIRDIFNSPEYRKARNNSLQENFPDRTLCDKCDLYNEGIWLTI
ncbi:MAG: SPASM domain-containing protein [bacterium]|nr:SPASM domain-containing protein [bacterium]